MKRKIILSWAVLALLLVPFLAMAHGQKAEGGQAVIYFNQACSSCGEYMEDTLVPVLEESGISDIIWRDYINEKENRAAYTNHNERLGVPLEYREHIMVIVNEKLVLSGHIPEVTLRESLELYDEFDKLMLFQKEMHGSVKEYTAWAFAGPIKTYGADASLTEYQEYFAANKESFTDSPSEFGKDVYLLPLVLWTGLVDGINPCAIAVLIFFLAFLFTLRSSVGRVFRYGLVYVAVIYLTYLGIGLGLFKALVISGQPHLMAKVGAWLVITLGLINVINYFVPRFPIKLRIPKFSQGTLKHWLTKATLPAVIVGAFLVGLCTFPCSGGIYVAVIGLLASSKTFWEGLGYLLVYNVMFVVPLLVLLALAGNRPVLAKIAKWHQKEDASLKLWSGLTMLALGVIILLWFV